LNELKLTIENINPAVLWGANNDHFEIIKKQYPKLKIVARGSDIKILGDENEINLFKDKLNKLIQHVEKFDSLNSNDLSRILGSSIQEPEPEANGDKSTTGEVIVFGVPPTSAAWLIPSAPTILCLPLAPRVPVKPIPL
jgi:phosphate starvation-inducible PhoH-like protein